MPSALTLGKPSDTFNESPGVTPQQGRDGAGPVQAQVGLSCGPLSLEPAHS